MSTRPLLLGEQLTARKHVDNGMRGLSQAGLRGIIGRINTTGSGTILLGDEAYTIVRNGTGDVSVTYLRKYTQVPAVVATAEVASLAGNFAGVEVFNPTLTGVQLRRKLTNASAGTTVLEDGIITFQVGGQ